MGMITKDYESNSSNLTGLLGVGSRFEGEVRFEGTLRIDGTLCGRIVCKNDEPSTVIISEMAEVEAEIIADNVIISGKVSGNIHAIERVEIHNPGRLEGTVYTCDMMIGDGALFQGECIMIRHLNQEEKTAIKYDGLQQVYEQKLVLENRQSIIAPEESSTNELDPVE
jgi:cytoskeletal protein CcmA (bactofilin family)